MKIGILTYHRVYNYGATLQAVALRLFLENLGHQVFYIDYYPEYHRQMYKAFDTRSLRRGGLKAKLYGLYINLKYYQGRRARIKAYKPFIEKQIAPYCIQDEREQYDVIVYGSDQIWRKQPGLNQSFNPIYFGKNNYRGKRQISYAASMGNLNLSDAERAFLQETLSRLEAVGVREKDLYDVLKPFNLSNLHLTLDPTMLLKPEEWDHALQTKRLIDSPYVLYYKVRESFKEEYIERFCREKGVRLVKVLPFDRPSGSDYHPSPAEFVSLIKYADFVLTSSFHGLAFSIIYRKELLVSIGSNSERLKGLMDSLGIGERFVPYGSPIPSDVCPIDYEDVHGRLEALQEDSSHFLAGAISSVMHTPISM